MLTAGSPLFPFSAAGCQRRYPDVSIPDVAGLSGREILFLQYQRYFLIIKSVLLSLLYGI